MMHFEACAFKRQTTSGQNVKFFSNTLKHYVRRIRDFCVYKVLHADDPPHRLALGIAVGMFVTFMPLIGLQMLISFFLAWLLRANKLVGVPLVWISNPLTIVPIYYPCYLLGCKVLGTPAMSEDWARVEASWHAMRDSATWLAKVQFWWDNTIDMVWPLGVGCLIVGFTAGVLSYYVSLFAIRSYRFRRWGQLMPPDLTPVDEAESTSSNAPDQRRNSASGGNAA